MRTILLLEDDLYEARLVTRLMEHEGYRVLHAPDAITGLELIESVRPDIILLDLGLPDMDGQTVAALLKNNPDLDEIPVVAVTAWPPDTARQMAKAYGCDGYISKPMTSLKKLGNLTPRRKDAKNFKLLINFDYEKH